jgi:hypothetical protein
MTLLSTAGDRAPDHCGTGCVGSVRYSDGWGIGCTGSGGGYGGGGGNAGGGGGAAGGDGACWNTTSSVGRSGVG